MSKIQWSCAEIGIDGWLLIAADLDLTGDDQPESMIGHRRAIHPFQVDECPGLLAQVIDEMSAVMGRMGTPTHSESRACVFGDRHEAAARA